MGLMLQTETRTSKSRWRLFGEQVCTSHSNLTSRPDNLAHFLAAANTGVYVKGLKTSSERIRDCSRVLGN